MRRLYRSRARREEEGDNGEIGCRGYTDQGPAERSREENGDNKENGCRGYTDQGPAEKRRATIKRADAGAIQIKGLQRGDVRQ